MRVVKVAPARWEAPTQSWIMKEPLDQQKLASLSYQFDLLGWLEGSNHVCVMCGCGILG